MRFARAAHAAALACVFVACNGLVGNEDLPLRAPTDKVDILIAVDNGPSGGDTQALLAQAIPTLLDRLAQPLCISADGTSAPVPSQNGACAKGVLEHRPIKDVHIGIVTSSLGSRGSDSCLLPSPNPDEKHADDRGHLVNRIGANEAPDPRAEASGFLAWAPDSDPDVVKSDAQSMTTGAGQTGCMFPAQLESWYRFLVQPDPYAKIAVNSVSASYSGIDDTILQQRHDFLRPDSAVVVIVVSPRNDASVDPRGWNALGWLWLDSRKKLRPKSGCETHPLDYSYCVSCADPGDDPNCAINDGYLTPAEDPLSLRFFQVERRFGSRPMFPIDRYVRGLTRDHVPDATGEHLHPIDDYGSNVDACTNPLYAASLPTSSNDERCKLPRGVRSADKVFLAVIGGVPNELLSFNPDDTNTGRISDGTWGKILGGSLEYNFHGVDARMRESIATRGANIVFDRDTHGIDLQYACIFPLPKARLCLNPNGSCECGAGSESSPLCDHAQQIEGKAYPMLRQLALAKAMGDEAVVWSACPLDVPPDDARAGYKPAMTMLGNKLAGVLAH